MTENQKNLVENVVCALLPIDGGPISNMSHRAELLNEVRRLAQPWGEFDPPSRRRIIELGKTAHRNGDTALGLACDFVTALGDLDTTPQPTFIRILLAGCGFEVPLE